MSQSSRRKIGLCERLIGGAFELLFIPSELRFRRRMQRAGRCLSLRACASRQECSPGTLIIEDPTAGWTYTRAWWTSDDISDAAPDPRSRDQAYHTAIQTGKVPDWDKWLWQEYLNPSTGTAHLLRVWRGYSLKAVFKDKFPKTAVVFTWSAVVLFERIKDRPAGQ